MRSSPASSLDLLFEPIKVCVRHVGVEFAEFPVVVAINPVAAAPDVADDHLRQPGLKLPRIPTGVMFSELEVRACPSSVLPSRCTGERRQDLPLPRPADECSSSAPLGVSEG